MCVAVAIAIEDKRGDGGMEVGGGERETGIPRIWITYMSLRASMVACGIIATVSW